MPWSLVNQSGENIIFHTPPEYKVGGNSGMRLAAKQQFTGIL
jgi:hypothetical protein